MRRTEIAPRAPNGSIQHARCSGTDQERWLLNGFQQSRARWDFLGQQIFFSQLDLTPGAERGFNTDGWDGYVANRDRIVAGWVNSPVRNRVVLTGDVHSHWAGEVHERFDEQSRLWWRPNW